MEWFEWWICTVFYVGVGVGVLSLAVMSEFYAPWHRRRWPWYVLTVALWWILTFVVGWLTLSLVAYNLYDRHARGRRQEPTDSWRPEDTQPGDTVRILLPDRKEEGVARVIGHNGEYIVVQYFDHGETHTCNLPTMCVLGPTDEPVLPPVWHAFHVETTGMPHYEVRQDADVLLLGLRDTLNRIREQRTLIKRITVGKVSGYTVNDMYRHLAEGRWHPLPGDCNGEGHAHAQEARSEVPTP